MHFTLWDLKAPSGYLEVVSFALSSRTGVKTDRRKHSDISRVH